MSNAAKFVLFTLGTAIGSFTTWYLVKKKYEKIAQDEIDSVKEAFSSEKQPIENDIPEEKPVEEKSSGRFPWGKEKPNLREYAKELKKNGYVNYSHLEDEAEEDDEEFEEVDFDSIKPPEFYFGAPPQVISEDEFGEMTESGEQYRIVSLTYYNGDGVLADNNDEPVSDIPDTVGEEYVDHFWHDAVHVRNDRLKCDYEILLDQRSHSEVIKSKPGYKEIE